MQEMPSRTLVVAPSVPVLQLSLKSDRLNEQQLYDYGIYNLRQQLAPVPGVTFPAPDGGKSRQIMVDIDPLKLQARGLTKAAVHGCQTVHHSIFRALLLHSFVRPAPRAFFRPDRGFPPPSRAAAVKDGAFFSAAEGLSLTDASTAAGYPRSGGRPRNDPRGACHWPRAIARTTLVFG
jgi:hypothetical protein